MLNTDQAIKDLDTVMYYQDVEAWNRLFRFISDVEKLQRTQVKQLPALLQPKKE